MKKNYYAKKLSAERSKLCYDIAPPRVQQYLHAETNFVLQQLLPDDHILELGCGYGRVLAQLLPFVHHVVGIDTAMESLIMARKFIDMKGKYFLINMNAVNLAFFNNTFDAVLCIQNGISAFKVDQRDLMKEAMRVTRPGGKVIFSSYSDKFWEARLHWFRLHVEHGLIGEIDELATKNGVIVCKDGFRATTVNQNDFHELASSIGYSVEINEIDESSVFCIIRK